MTNAHQLKSLWVDIKLLKSYGQLPKGTCLKADLANCVAIYVRDSERVEIEISKIQYMFIYKPYEHANREPS